MTNNNSPQQWDKIKVKETMILLENPACLKYQVNILGIQGIFPVTLAGISPVHLARFINLHHP